MNFSACNGESSQMGAFLNTFNVPCSNISSDLFPFSSAQDTVHTSFNENTIILDHELPIPDVLPMRVHGTYVLWQVDTQNIFEKWWSHTPFYRSLSTKPRKNGHPRWASNLRTAPA